MTVKLVHVGLGGWGQDWEMNAIPPVAQIERVAWVDAHEPTLAAARKRLGLPADRASPPSQKRSTRWSPMLCW